MHHLPIRWATSRAIVLVLAAILAATVVGAVPVSADGPGELSRPVASGSIR